MKKKLFMRSAITGILLACSACNKENADDGGWLPEGKPIVLKAEFHTKCANSRNFALDLFKEAVIRSNGDNVLLSPFSVNTALSMVWNGADGKTAEELALVLGNDGYTREQMNEYSKTLTDGLVQVDPSTDLKIANSMWADITTPFLPAFVQTNRQWYNATVENVDFRKTQTLRAIDQWGLEKTGNRIENISEGISESTRFALINAVYFKGIWKNRFEISATLQEVFINSAGQKNTVPMMNQQEALGYADDGAEWKMLSLPYGNGAFSMVILMPFADTPLDDQIPSLTAEKFQTLLLARTQLPISVKLPKFTAEYTYFLHKKILPALGLKRIFRPELAEIVPICGMDMYVNMVSHKTAIEIDEQGTKAAGVTVNTGIVTSVDPGTPINFFVDHPFVYAIVENSTGTILFIGRVNSL